MKDLNPWSRALLEILGRVPRLRGSLGVVGLAVILLALVLCVGADALTKILSLCGIVVLAALVTHYEERRRKR